MVVGVVGSGWSLGRLCVVVALAFLGFGVAVLGVDARRVSNALARVAVGCACLGCGGRSELLAVE